MNITQARQSLSDLVSGVASTKKSVVIIRDSMPEAVLVPYDAFVKNAEEKDRLWALAFDRVLAEGKRAFSRWAKTRGVDRKKLTEEAVYALVAQA